MTSLATFLFLLLSLRAAASDAERRCWDRQPVVAGTYYRAFVKTWYTWGDGVESSYLMTCYFETQALALADAQHTCDRMARTGSSGCDMNTIRYQAITLPETEPRTPYAVYIINKETIYCVNGNEDSPPAKVLGKAGNWPGFGAIVESAQSLYVAEQALFKVSTWDGSYKRLGSGTWEESTSMAWFGDLYIIQRGSLYSADQTTGQYKLLGRPDDWQGHTSMAAVMLDRDGVSSRRLFVIQSEKLWEVARDGTYKRVGIANWYTPAYISAIGEALYAIENSRFQYIDGNTGQYTVIGEAVYSQTTAFAGADGQAFAIDAGRLLRINIYDGSHVKLSDGWDGPSVMTVVRNAKCRSE